MTYKGRYCVSGREYITLDGIEYAGNLWGSKYYHIYYDLDECLLVNTEGDTNKAVMDCDKRVAYWKDVVEKYDGKVIKLDYNEILSRVAAMAVVSTKKKSMLEKVNEIKELSKQMNLNRAIVKLGEYMDIKNFLMPNCWDFICN